MSLNENIVWQVSEMCIQCFDAHKLDCVLCTNQPRPGYLLCDSCSAKVTAEAIVNSLDGGYKVPVTTRMLILIGLSLLKTRGALKDKASPFWNEVAEHCDPTFRLEFPVAFEALDRWVRFHTKASQVSNQILHEFEKDCPTCTNRHSCPNAEPNPKKQE